MSDFLLKIWNYFWIFLLVIWKNTDYNVGNGYNIIDGKFTAPVDGIYSFYTQAESLTSNYSNVAFYINGSHKSNTYRNKEGEHDTLTLSSQFKLNKGDTVWVYFTGYFFNPRSASYTFFEGHLIRKINS